MACAPSATSLISISPTVTVLANSVYSNVPETSSSFVLDILYFTAAFDDIVADIIVLFVVWAAASILSVPHIGFLLKLNVLVSNWSDEFFAASTAIIEIFLAPLVWSFNV